MININGNLFVKNDSELLDSLFSPPNNQTAAGYYQRVKNGFRLFTLDGNPMAFMKQGNHPLLLKLSKLDNGKWEYGSIPEQLAKALGFDKIRPLYVGDVINQIEEY